MLAVRTPEASTRHVAVSGCCLPRRGIGSAASITFDFAALPCGSGLSLRSLALRPATFLSTLRSGCYQTPRKTRYAAARLRLCRHPRRLNSTRLQGATPYPNRTFTGWIAPTSPGAHKQTLTYTSNHNLLLSSLPDVAHPYTGQSGERVRDNGIKF